MRKSLLGDAAAGAGAPGSPAYKVLLDQLNASCEELEVRKEEVLILRSQLVSQKEAMQHKVKSRLVFRKRASAHSGNSLKTRSTSTAPGVVTDRPQRANVRTDVGASRPACTFAFSHVTVCFVCQQ